MTTKTETVTEATEESLLAHIAGLEKAFTEASGKHEALVLRAQALEGTMKGLATQANASLAEYNVLVAKRLMAERKSARMSLLNIPKPRKQRGPNKPKVI